MYIDIFPEQLWIGTTGMLSLILPQALHFLQ